MVSSGETCSNQTRWMVLHRPVEPAGITGNTGTSLHFSGKNSCAVWRTTRHENRQTDINLLFSPTAPPLFTAAALPAQMVDATLAWSLLAGVSNSKVFSRALVQAQRDLVELRLSDGRQVGSSREVLPQQ